MLKITSLQIKTLSRFQLKFFEEKTLSRLSEFFIQCRNWEEARGRQLIHKGIERAAKYRITRERDVAKYIGLMVALDENFDTLSPYSTVLLDATLDGASKMAALYAQLAPGDASLYSSSVRGKFHEKRSIELGLAVDSRG
ncbi:hypothetical protein [Stigmatella aurantiaca]|uniref:hypothetical protein n=1 Tax=Stigmatella aurantiaca TaxID=41 RepID=UPI00116040F8|nr:hypothetical protein [Stigmatella aurantiaca]